MPREEVECRGFARRRLCAAGTPRRQRWNRMAQLPGCEACGVPFFTSPAHKGRSRSWKATPSQSPAESCGECRSWSCGKLQGNLFLQRQLARGCSMCGVNSSTHWWTSKATSAGSGTAQHTPGSSSRPREVRTAYEGGGVELRGPQPPQQLARQVRKAAAAVKDAHPSWPLPTTPSRRSFKKRHAGFRASRPDRAAAHP